MFKKDVSYSMNDLKNKGENFMNLDTHITDEKPKNSMVIDNNKKPDEIIIEDKPATITRGGWQVDVLFSLKNNGEFLFKRHRENEPAKGNAKKIAERLGTELKMPGKVYLNENEFRTFPNIYKIKNLSTRLTNSDKRLDTVYKGINAENLLQNLKEFEKSLSNLDKELSSSLSLTPSGSTIDLSKQ